MGGYVGVSMCDKWHEARKCKAHLRKTVLRAGAGRGVRDVVKQAEGVDPGV